MPKLTWNPTNEPEVRAARAAFEVYTKHKFVAWVAGRQVREFRPQLGTLTFERIPTAYDRVLKEDDPWDS